MLLLNKYSLEKLCNKVDEYELTFNDYDFAETIIDDFERCVDKCDEDEQICFSQFIKGVKSTAISLLDPRRENFDNFICTRYEDIMQFSNSILMTPLCLIFRKHMGKDNYFLQLQHKLKTHMIGDQVAVTLQEITNSMFYLNSIKLFPMTTLESYVSSMSTQTIAYAGNSMSNCGQTDDCQSSTGCDKNPHGICSDVAFPSNLVLKDCGVYSKYKYSSLDELNELLISDIKALLEENGDNWLYGKKFVHSYIDQYINYVDAVIRENKDVLHRMIKLLNLTIRIYCQYHHKLTALVMIWVVVVLKNKHVCNADNINMEYLVDISFRSYNNKIFDMKLSYSNHVCDLFTLIVMSEETLREFELLKHDCGLSYTESHTNVLNEQVVPMLNGETDTTEPYTNSSYNRIEQSSSQLTRTLCESFEVLKDGTIRIVLKSKTTYMDEYASNHRLLKYNEQENDITGMKYNLVYALLLVESIERTVIHNPKVDKNSQEYKDSQKARSFALNDISTYLPKIRKVDKGFDLNRFYAKVKADKCTIEIDAPQTISGLKRIVKAVLL